MKLQICVSSCAHAIVVRGSPDPGHTATEGLRSNVICCTHDAVCAEDATPLGEPTEFPDDDLDWEVFDPTPLESWILDDFDWEIEVPYPERGDYWDDSLDREWDLAAQARRRFARRDRGADAAPLARFCIPNLRVARQSLADHVFSGGAWEQALSPVPRPPSPEP